MNQRMEQLPALLKRLELSRKMRDESLRQFAKYLGISHATYSTWRAGEAEPGELTLRRIKDRYPQYFGEGVTLTIGTDD